MSARMEEMLTVGIVAGTISALQIEAKANG
jgi:hypothetical protein